MALFWPKMGVFGGSWGVRLGVQKRPKKGQKRPKNSHFWGNTFWTDFSNFRGGNTLGSFRVFLGGKHPGKGRVKFCVKITPKNTFLRRAAHPPGPPRNPPRPRGLQ